MMYKPILTHGDTVCIIACSDGVKEDYSAEFKSIVDILEKMGLKIMLARTIFRVNGPFSGSPKARASELMRAFSDKDIKAIFDISGGDSANQILDFLDYEILKNNSKPFFGMSDLTVILNSLFSCSAISTYHYSIRNLVGEDSTRQVEKFKNSFFKGTNDIYEIDYNWIQGNKMKGIVIGGNIRCFLKLAGTRYLPNPNDKILFLESLGGRSNRMVSLLTQLKHIGFLDKINGIILGTFTEMESNKSKPDTQTLVAGLLNDKQLPIIKTSSLGHGEDAGCIVIGEEIELSR